MAGPTARQIEIYEVVQRHGGDLTAAGRELGIHRVSVKKSRDAYLLNTGQPEPPGKIPTAQAVLRLVPERLDVLESQTAGIASGIDALAREVSRLAAQVQELNARQPIMLVGVRNERKADGGRGGRHEQDALVGRR